MSEELNLQTRQHDLEQMAKKQLDVLVIGGGITGEPGLPWMLRLEDCRSA